MSKPVIVIIADGHKYQIWPDGRTTGFGPAAMVINRIPQYVAETIDQCATGNKYDE